MNYFFLTLIISSSCLYFLNYFFKKNQIFIDKVKISEHKKFTKEKNVPFTGGIFVLFAIFYTLDDLINKSCYLIFDFFIRYIFRFK